MSVTLNATQSDQFANSYVTVAECDDFWLGHYSAERAAQWAALTDDQKTRLLIKACRVIETSRFTVEQRSWDSRPLHYDRRTRLVMQLNLQLTPIKWYAYQSLQFPRNLDRDVETGDTFIPQPVKDAQCEQAVYTLNFDSTAIANRVMGVTHDSTYVGSIRLRQEYTAGGSEWCPEALEYVKPFMLKSSFKTRRQ